MIVTNNIIISKIIVIFIMIIIIKLIIVYCDCSDDSKLSNLVWSLAHNFTKTTQNNIEDNNKTK